MLAAVAALVGIVSLLWSSYGPGDRALPDPKAKAREVFEGIAQQVPGLTVVTDENGWPSLHGLVDGVAIEIDHANHIARGMEAMLGMRCNLVEAEHAPNAALWIGEVEALRRQFGRPRPSGDRHGIFEVYTRVEPSASDWWQEPELHEALVALPGGGLLLVEGKLTVVFSNLDAESVRAAMAIPGHIRRGVQRVTIH